MNPSDCASWVQAIGSILAIIVSVLAAIGVARHSANQARAAYDRDRTERLAEKIGPVMALLEAADDERKIIWDAVVHANYGGEWGVSSGLLSNLESIHEALEEIPVHSMPSGEAATSLIDARVWLRSIVKAGQALVSKAMKADDITAEHGQDFAAASAKLLLERDRLRLELVRLTLPIDETEGSKKGVIRRLIQKLRDSFNAAS